MTIPNTTVAFSGGSVLFNGTTVAFGEDCCCGTAGTTTPGTGSPGTCACYQFGTSASQSTHFAGYITINVNDDDWSDNSNAWTVSITRGTSVIATGSSLAGNLVPRNVDITGTTAYFPFGFPFFFYAGSSTTVQTTASGTVNIGNPGDDFTPDGTPGTTAVGFLCNTGDQLPAAFKRYSLVGHSCASPQYTGTVLILDYPLNGTCATMAGTFNVEDNCGGAPMKFAWGTAAPVGTSFVATNNPDATLTVTGSTWTIDNSPVSAICGFSGTKDSTDGLPPSGSWNFYPKPSVCSTYLDPNAPFVSVASRSFEDLYTGEVL